MFVSCFHREVVEGSGVGSAGCVVHVDVHGEVLLWEAADVVCLVCRSYWKA